MLLREISAGLDRVHVPAAHPAAEFLAVESVRWCGTSDVCDQGVLVRVGLGLDLVRLVYHRVFQREAHRAVVMVQPLGERPEPVGRHAFEVIDAMEDGQVRPDVFEVMPEPNDLRYPLERLAFGSFMVPSNLPRTMVMTWLRNSGVSCW